MFREASFVCGRYAGAVPPTRIVSLVPSLTELIAYLGAGDSLVGRTRYCTEPASIAQRVPAAGGTKDPDIAAIAALKPDLVIANKEENRREDVEALRARGIEVLVTEIDSVREAIDGIRQMGDLLERREPAAQLEEEIEAALLTAQLAQAATRVYVAVWHNPMLGPGAATYGQSLIDECGGVNVLGHRERYPELAHGELAALSPDFILLPDEPFPFDDGHARYYGQFAPARVIDGKLLWWYGPRMPAAIGALRAIFREAQNG